MSVTVHPPEVLPAEVPSLADQWDALASSALLGTARRPPPPPLAGVLCDLLADRPSGDDASEALDQVALLTVSPRNARVRARSDVRCLAISRHVFTLLLDAQPSIAATMLPIVARRLSGH